MARHASRFVATTLLGLAIAMVGGTAPGESITADAIYQAAGVQGGLVVHFGCGAGS